MASNVSFAIAIPLALAGCTATEASAPAPDWQRWSAAPAGCHIEREVAPDHRILAWRPCPGGGCDALDAPWADASGWGYGGLLAAARDDRGRAVLAVSRSPEHGVWESIVFRDERGVAALRITLPDARCVAGGPWLGPDGEAAVAVATLDEAAAVIATGSIDRIADAPVVTPLGARLAGDVVTVAARRVVVSGPSRYAVVEPGGVVWTPRAGDPRPAGPVVAAGDGVAFVAERDGRDGIWRADRAGATRWYAEPAASIEAIAGDRATLVWIRRLHESAAYELWVAPVAPTPAPRRIAIVVGDAPAIAIGDGRIAIRIDDRAIEVYAATSARLATLVAPPGLAFAGGARFAALAGDDVYVKAYPIDGSANDVRAILRWRVAGKIAPAPASP